jgi:two-component system KDP operon response regulator KdpE
MSSECARILVVDDERPIRKFLRTTLSAQGFDIFEAVDGHEALLSAASYHPDVIILDLGLPDMDGLEVIRHLREWSQTPVIVLSVREQEQVKVRALDFGADDYLTKPFGVSELLARIRVALRRSAKSGDEPIFQVQGLKIDLARRLVLLDEKEIALSPIEYEILKVMVQHAGRVLTHRQILKMVWGEGYEDQAHLLRVTVSHLRKKIENDSTRPCFLLTEPGVGYRLKTED